MIAYDAHYYIIMTHQSNPINNLFLLEFFNLHLKYSVKNNKMSQLPADCLHEIFEYLEYLEDCLHSCLLVNHLWCEVSVRILWRSPWNYRTLIACLPNESKEILYENGIIISPPTSKPLMFNYVSFCKELTFRTFEHKIDCLLRNTVSATHTLMQEITKLL